LLHLVARVLRERELPPRQNFLTPLRLMDAHRNAFLHHHWLRYGLVTGFVTGFVTGLVSGFIASVRLVIAIKSNGVIR
jgi:hypothetical protein